MFSTTFKQSVATLGVVAGLLAAAAPASAGTMGVNTGHEGTSARFLKAPASPTSEGQRLFKGEMVGLEPFEDRHTIPAGLVNGCAPGSAPVRQVGSEDVKTPVPASLVDYAPGVCYLHTVKAPANAMSAGISGKEMTEAVKAPASPTSEVFTSVSNVAPPHGDATTIGGRHEAARNDIALNTLGGNTTLRGHGITCLDQDLHTVKGPTNSPGCGGSQTDSLKDTMVSGYNVKADAEGTQLGSEGV